MTNKPLKTEAGDRIRVSQTHPHHSSFFSNLGRFFKRRPPLQQEPSGTPKQKKPKKPSLSIRRIILRLFLTLCAWGFGFLMLAVLWFSYDLPDINRLQSTSRKPSVTIQASDGSIIGVYGDIYEDTVGINDLPAYVPQAFMAIEDRRFYNHFGVDVVGLIRAAYANYKAQRVVQGGSTLTQQLAKNFLFTQGLYDTNDRSLRRKIQEVIMAIWLEWKFSKNQILTIYLNRVYFGAGTYGIDAAARTYFGKPAQFLSVYEAAIIAGLMKAPSRYSPAHHPQRARGRAMVVLQKMQEAGYITSPEAYLPKEGEETRPEAFREQGSKFFANWIYESIPGLIGGYDQDLVVITTLDPVLQKHAETVAQTIMTEQGKEMKASEISVVSMTPKGGVKAMVGGLNYSKSQFNRATQALRQPGSTFKTFVYLAALEAGYTPDSMISDAPISIGGWSPKNFRTYVPSEDGEVTMIHAFAKSINTVTVRLAQHLGGKRIAHVAQRLGITSHMMTDLSICLGTTELTLIELVAAYATFANNGYSVWPYGIVEIRNKKGEILYQRQDTAESQVISPQHNQQMVRLLTAVVDSGTGRAAKLSIPVAGKSGSNADKDAWFIGFVKNLVTGIWVGNDDPRVPMKKESTGGRLPARTWALFMKRVLEEAPIAGDTTLTEQVNTILGNDVGGEDVGEEPIAPPSPAADSPVVVTIPQEDADEFEALVNQVATD